MYSRICIFGRPGSGKSTFSQILHAQTQIPLYHLDRYYFTANWVERNYQEFLALQRYITQQDRWIIDGNALKSLEMRYARAELVLYFNYPRWLCLWRLIKRRLSKDRAIEDRAEGCREMISWKLLKYMWTFEYRNNYSLMHQLAELRARYPDVIFLEIRNDSDLKLLIKQLN
jgi:adenylate kinase family enzyme